MSLKSDLILQLRWRLQVQSAQQILQLEPMLKEYSDFSSDCEKYLERLLFDNSISFQLKPWHSDKNSSLLVFFVTQHTMSTL